jgi:hypothetical protein
MTNQEKQVEEAKDDLIRTVLFRESLGGAYGLLAVKTDEKVATKAKRLRRLMK